ncbi:MAG: hypothetical protein WDM81_02365 [Rhizomicrobium sp.]
MEITRRVMTNVAAPEPSGKAPMNRFGHKRAFPMPTSLTSCAPMPTRSTR